MKTALLFLLLGGSSLSDFKLQWSLEPSQIKKISSLTHFSNSAYHNLNIAGTLDFFTRRYVIPISKLVNISECIAVDSGCGYGWFSVAYLLNGGKGSIAMDLDPDRLSAARKISSIFSLKEDRIEFICSPIEETPLPQNSADIFVSIETLEHVGLQKVQPALSRIRDIASKIILITTPNKLFPIIAHDTRLPFVHWLPPGRRRLIARIFNRSSMDRGNEFLTPFDLNIILDKFRPISTCLTYLSFREYIEDFPIYVPYGCDENLRFKAAPPRFKSLYYFLVSHLLGTHSYWAMPTLTSIFIRRK